MRAGATLMEHETRRPKTGPRDAGGISIAGGAPGQGGREAGRRCEITGHESHLDLQVAEGVVGSWQRRTRVGRAPSHGTAYQTHADAAGASVSLDQRP